MQEAYRPPRSHSNFLLFGRGGRGGGAALDKNFFLVWTCIKPNLVSKIFPFTVGGGGGGGAGRPSTKIFFPVWTCIKPNLVSKIFPFTVGGGGGEALDKNFFSSLNMYQAKFGVKNFSLYCGGVGVEWPWTKIFFPVWTCIKPNLVSKIFPFTVGGGGGAALDKNFFLVWTCIKPNLVSKIFPFTVGGGGRGQGGPWQKFFFRSEHVSSQIWCQIFFPLLGGRPLTKNFFPVWTCIKPNLVSKNFPFTETGYPPPPPWTDTHLWKHNFPSYVRTRAVKIKHGVSI